MFSQFLNDLFKKLTSVFSTNFIVISGAAAALNSEKGRLRDRLIRMEYLAAETKERYLGPGESEKFIRRRMQKMGNCRRSRRYTEKREGRRESELLKALESSMNKVRKIQIHEKFTEAFPEKSRILNFNEYVKNT